MLCAADEHARRDNADAWDFLFRWLLSEPILLMVTTGEVENRDIEFGTILADLTPIRNGRSMNSRS